MAVAADYLQEPPRAPLDALDFHLPPALEAGEPPEARGLSRDEVRLMVSYRGGAPDGRARVLHTTFRELPAFVDAGDVLVINTSGTMNASLPAVRGDGTSVERHPSTPLPGDLWTAEVRALTEGGRSGPTLDDSVLAGETLALPGGASAQMLAPYRCGCHDGWSRPRGRSRKTRLWTVLLHLRSDVAGYLEQYGSPIRYGYVREEWPSSYYQTAYATELGSAEMPSAGRPFTPELLTRLVARGVLVAPLLLHTGVASLEAHEPPYEEFYRVPPETAQLVNLAHAGGKRVVAVGTTAVRALETVTDSSGTTHPGEGWTCVVITPERGIRAVDGLLTGLHEPRSSHLAMMEALAGRDHLRRMYEEALREGYLWHEFGDLHLILP